MWEEIRTPEGKLLFRINRKEKLVEGKKGGLDRDSQLNRKGGESGKKRRPKETELADTV